MTLTGQSRTDLVRSTELLSEIDLRDRQRLFYKQFPDEDMVQSDGSIIYAREKYAKHLEFFKAGPDHRERCFLAGNPEAQQALACVSSDLSLIETRLQP